LLVDYVLQAEAAMKEHSEVVARAEDAEQQLQEVQAAKEALEVAMVEKDSALEQQVLCHEPTHHQPTCAF
jgi:F420-0:gamma-glutamyl ligase